MRKWLPTILGFSVGFVIGLYVLFFVKPQETPWFVSGPVESISRFLQHWLMPNSDPMAAFLFMIPLIPLYCAVIGAGVGFSLGLLLAAFPTVGKDKTID